MNSRLNFPVMLFVLLVLAIWSNRGTKAQPVEDESGSKNPTESASKEQPPDWINGLLDDPLLATADEEVTLDDLQEALADDMRRDTVIERHFARANSLSNEERESFLRQALQHESLTVRRQAADQLSQLGMLEQVAAELFLELIRNDRPELREAAVLALERLQLNPSDITEDYFKALIEALGSDDYLTQQAAERQLEDLGAEAVPALFPALKSENALIRQRAAALLSRIVGSKPPQPLAMGGPSGEAPVEEAIAKGHREERSRAMVAGRDYQERRVDAKTLNSVRVYFGTNREKLASPPNPWVRLIVYPFAFIAAVIVLYFRYRKRKTTEQTTRRSGIATAVITLLCLGVAGWSISQWNGSLRELYSQRQGERFGPRRNTDGKIRYGYCDVSIPLTHDVGEVEQPIFGPEDESRHVIVRRTEVMSDQSFYEALRNAMAQASNNSRDCFVFIHGYNVSFETAARRTAQIHFDLKFQGAPLFYSWPSRGSLRHYFSDRGEIRYSHEHIKNFLVGVYDKLQPERMHVIAHSMGADAVCQAINQLDPQRYVFDQIVLAAPDIDADVFKQQIAPRLTSRARRTTMYCSRKDWALYASYAFNDSPRAGDSSGEILVVTGVDTIDATEIDTALIGHSYYGDCIPLLEDVRLLFERNLAPPERKLHEIFKFEKPPYWAFEPR